VIYERMKGAVMEDKMIFEPQVPREHYFKGYDTKERFISYWYQMFDGEHYWDVGKKGDSIRSIVTNLSKLFEVEWYYFIPDNPYHIMFVLDANNKPMCKKVC